MIRQGVSEPGSRRESAELAREGLTERGGVAGEGQAGVEIHDAITDESGDLAIEVLHPFRRAGFHDVEQSLSFALAFFNALASASVGFEHFEDRHAAAAVGFGNQTLADDVAKRFGEALADRLLLGWRKRTHNALDRLGSVHGVEAGKDEMSGLGGFEDNFDGLAVPHLAHENYLGSLPHGRTQGMGEAGRIAMEFALVNGRALVIVQKLDRVFDGDDVVVLLPVDAVEQDRKSGGFAGTGWSGDQDDAIAQAAYFGQMLRQAQRGRFRNEGGNHAHHDGATAALDKYIDSKAGETGNSVRDIASALLAQRGDGLLVIADQVGGNLTSIVGSEES